MANASFLTSGNFGASMAKRTTTPEFELGLVAFGNGNSSWAYGQASETVATGTCTYDPATFLITDLAGAHTADTAFAANEYGWVKVTAGASQ